MAARSRDTVVRRAVARRGRVTCGRATQSPALPEQSHSKCGNNIRQTSHSVQGATLLGAVSSWIGPDTLFVSCADSGLAADRQVVLLVEQAHKARASY